MGYEVTTITMITLIIMVMIGIIVDLELDQGLDVHPYSLSNETCNVQMKAGYLGKEYRCHTSHFFI
jgi:hypothetical protein